MSRSDAIERPLADAIAAWPADVPRVVLAVSGGCDSMVLLHAMARWAPERVAAVATFDHGTGEHAREAAELVVREARRLGLPVSRERSRDPGRSEAAWREARWAFLRRASRAYHAPVATAHTADDQVETIVQRLLRGAGARGLAALAADGPVVRPWLDVSRAAVRRCAEHWEVPFRRDPANDDFRHQRVRVRHDLLPALERVDPGFSACMLALGTRAATWRRDVEALVDTLPWVRVAPGTWQVPRTVLAGWSEEALQIVWPAMLGRAGLLLPAEGTRRLIRFTIGAARAGELRLPGGATVVRLGDLLEVRDPSASGIAARQRTEGARTIRVGEVIVWPGWRITPCAGAVETRGGAGCEARRQAVGSNAEVAAFPASAMLQVRAWQPGDRISLAEAGAGRRIARYLAECGIPRLDRTGWPVVLLDGEVVWVPGVCGGTAAPHRSGRSDLIWYRSEREFG
jgi:tRNA(Ile)-lysidine synthase